MSFLQSIKEKVQSCDQTTIITIIFVLVAGFISYDVFSGELSNNGNGIESARQQLRNVEQQQSTAIGTISTIETGLSDSQQSVNGISNEVSEVREGLADTQSTISHATDSITTSENTVGSSTELISDCQRIVSSIKERGTEIKN